MFLKTTVRPPQICAFVLGNICTITGKACATENLASMSLTVADWLDLSFAHLVVDTRWLYQSPMTYVR